MRGKQPRNEQGSALVMALVMLTVIGLMVGAALTYSSTSLRASNNTIRPNRASLYAADSAIQGAIEYIRDNPEMSSDVLERHLHPELLPLHRPQGRRGDGRRLPAERLPHLRRQLPRRPAHARRDRRPTASSRPQRRCEHRRPRLVELQDRARQPNAHGDERPAASGRGAAATAPTTSRCRRTSQRCATHSTNPTSRVASPRSRSTPPIPRSGHVADWQPAEAAPASFVQPAIPACTADNMTLQPGVYYDGDEFSTKLNACDNVTLSPGVYYLNFPAGKDEWRLDNERRRPVRHATRILRCRAYRSSSPTARTSSSRARSRSLRPQRDTERSDSSRCTA